MFNLHHYIEVVCRDESRDMWRVHLERGEYETALEYCRTSDEKVGSTG